MRSSREKRKGGGRIFRRICEEELARGGGAVWSFCGRTGMRWGGG
jgi:hypothetical protein